MEPDLCYRALRARDARFDGRFFTGVASTGVFCRPICPARTPLRENCRFFASAAAARDAGYRPCLRCRPEAAPGTPAWCGSEAAVGRALRLIGEGALDEGGVEVLAARVGVGGRHLRRLFLRHVGATPVAVAQTRRLLFAKKLLDETDLPMTEVALAAGFGSIRRFNESLRATYGKPPRELRRRRRSAVASDGIRMRLAYRPPLDLPGLLAFLGSRAIPGVECVRGGVWRRAVRGPTQPARVEVRALEGHHEIEVRVSGAGGAILADVASRARRVFDLGADPASIAQVLRGDALLSRELDRHPGVRVPGAWDPFELAVRAILGQQVTVRGATTLAARLVEKFGDPLSEPDEGLTHLFPLPERLARADLTTLGLPRARAGAISGLAQVVADGSDVLRPGRELDAIVEGLCALPGVGPWTAHYVALRGLGEPDAFPDGDLGLRKAIAPGAPAASAAALRDRAEACRPWRGYAAMLLWRSLAA